MSLALVWFRRDLRLQDNPALNAATKLNLPILPVYIDHSDEQIPWSMGAASRWWLHHSLLALKTQFEQWGITLCIKQGNPLTVLQDLIKQAKITHIFWNRLYDPHSVLRDQLIKKSLREQGYHAESFNSQLLFEPWEIQNKTAQPYRVFTPFWRQVRPHVTQTTIHPFTPPVGSLKKTPSLTIEDLQLLPKNMWGNKLHAHWTPGEINALSTLETFQTHISDYAIQRDYPDTMGTSRLSPHLHFGEISPQQIIYYLLKANTLLQIESYVRELVWREFSFHLLYHFPQTTNLPMNSHFTDFPWQPVEQKKLRAWQQGKTGIPIVDAGMRELWQTGWMHNRVRMVVASFLTKNLRYHWLEGAKWFWDTLVDADLANNTQGWQWVAGCGADAAPYFRIFNPIRQSQNFDSQGGYIKKWIPELQTLPKQAIHAPWQMTPTGLQTYGLSKTVYAQPIIDLTNSRTTALDAYQSMRHLTNKI